MANPMTRRERERITKFWNTKTGEVLIVVVSGVLYLAFAVLIALVIFWR